MRIKINSAATSSLIINPAAASGILVNQGTPSFVGAYDAFESDLLHVYEPARRVLTSYTGDLIRLRRDSDNAESDFGYDTNGDLDTAAISTWLGGASGYIATIYDQKGGDDVTQSTATAQPLYVASGQNSKPMMGLDGNGDCVFGAFSSAIAQPLTIFATAQLDTPGVGAKGLFDGFDAGNRCAVYSSGIDYHWTYASATQREDGNDDGLWNVFSARFNGGGDSYLRKNGSPILTLDPGTQGIQGVTIGNFYTRTTANSWDGSIACILVCSDIVDPTVIETAINDYWSIY